MSKNGYDQFFKQARKAVNEDTRAPKKRVKLNINSDQEVEDQIRSRFKMSSQKKVKKSTTPWKMIMLSLCGFLTAGMGILHYEEIESFLHKIEVGVGPVAYAAPAAVGLATTPDSSVDNNTASSKAILSDAEVGHLQKLTDRKKELDAREEELNRLDSELQVQRVDLDKRLKELEEMRATISSILENKVKIDQERVETLVQMYTNMKAPQAAKVFETMDEDLAIEILGRMKKKNAADIMNLLKPEKAQVLSEMFAGFKRKPASE